MVWKLLLEGIFELNIDGFVFGKLGCLGIGGSFKE